MLERMNGKMGARVRINDIGDLPQDSLQAYMECISGVCPRLWDTPPVNPCDVSRERGKGDIFADSFFLKQGIPFWVKHYVNVQFYRQNERRSIHERRGEDYLDGVHC